MRIMVATALIFLLPATAHAFCSRGFGYDFESKLNAELNYLICLHNEQNESLNEQADIINSQSRLIQSLNSDIETLRSQISDLEYQILLLREER